jgi:dTDP-glucose 4,6-dehydratase
MSLPLPASDVESILKRTRPLWEQMRGKRLFLTGGTGFFGCWLVESFLAANEAFSLKAELHVLSRVPEKFLTKCPHLTGREALHFVKGDIRDFEFPDGEFEFVIHAATETSGNLAAEDPVAMLSTIVDGTRHTLNFAATHQTKGFLLTSSGAVYGVQPADISHISEKYMGAPNPLQASSVYAEGKRAAELMCAVYGSKYGIECKIARCFAFVGPHLLLDAHFAIGNFIGDALSGIDIQISGDGMARRSYMYGADLAVALWTMLFKAPALEAFNIGSGQSMSILEVAQAVVKATGSEAQICVAKQHIPGTMVHQYVPNPAKAESVLGIRCEVGLEEAVRRTFAWYKAQKTEKS